ncbi:hypothetical protein [Ornithinimicrobium murale]|uniref:hypothetical protein n=1 Tax=Ornithinimicrobium murale TaxID=1050153 RepID=UPI0013B41A1A|nr:hypothetical protein [Ornithinimicrobium murale]
MADCLTAEGFPAEADPDGSWGFGAAPGQHEAAMLAEYVCLARYPLAAEYVEPLDPVQLRVHYDWLIEETLPCMAGLGYPIPEPPSWPTYQEQYATDGSIFFADEALDPATIASDMSIITADCEVKPPSDLLYPAEG